MRDVDILAEMVARIDAARTTRTLRAIDEAVVTLRNESRVSPARAAQLLGVHENTVRKQARKTLDGKPSPLRDVQRDERGCVTIDIAEVLTLRSSGWRRRGGSIL